MKNTTQHELLTSQEMRILANHLYELRKGVRKLILFTLPKRFEQIAQQRLKSQEVDYTIQHVNDEKINLYFGRKECVEAIKIIASRPLNQLSPEEDFILGTMLGYDICAQCERYRKLKQCSGC
ncbi:MAG: DUF2023 family protein [Rikenellaceae bacterium]